MQPDMNKTITLTRTKTIKILDITHQVQKEQMAEMGKTIGQKTPTTPEEQMTIMVDMMVMQLKAQDKIYIKTKEEDGHAPEAEEFEAALLHYCAKDPVVAKHMQNYMQQMRSAY